MHRLVATGGQRCTDREVAAPRRICANRQHPNNCKRQKIVAMLAQYSVYMGSNTHPHHYSAGSPNLEIAVELRAVLSDLQWAAGPSARGVKSRSAPNRGRRSKPATVPLPEIFSLFFSAGCHQIHTEPKVPRIAGQ